MPRFDGLLRAIVALSAITINDVARREVGSSVIRSVLRFRIELRDIAPAIWREIEVPGGYSFWDLHVAIQDAMGWLDYHLHAFVPTDGKTNGGNWEIGIPDADEQFASRETLAGWQVPVAEHFQYAGDRMIYLYDFGDGWTHDVLLEEIVACDSTKRAACTGGARACPPEDCGGPFGYQTMLEALADPAHEQHTDMRNWTAGAFDPENFHPEQVKFDDPKARWNRAFSQS
jgi:hypothetical protein